MRPTLPQRIVRGLGSMVGHNYDANAMVEKAAQQLRVEAPTMDFVNSDGWARVRKQYRELINEMKRRIIFLSTNTRKHEDEIQRTSDLVGACELILDLTNRAITAHQEAHDTITKNTGTAGGAR